MSNASKDISQDLRNLSNIEGAPTVSLERDRETLSFVCVDIPGERLSAFQLIWEGHVLWERETGKIPLYHRDVQVVWERN